MNHKYHLPIFFLISLLTLSLPLAIKLVNQSQDSRSSASETSENKINLKIAFKGVKPDSVCLSSLKNIDLDIVNVTKKAYQSQESASIIPVTGETNKSGDQIFLITGLVLGSNLKEVDSSNYIQIKYQTYLKSRMCFNNQSDKVANTAACDLTLTNGTTYDFSNYSLSPGDLNQDGIVNSADFSIIKHNIDPSAEIKCNQEGDLNYDGVINSFDISFLKKSLFQTDDETIIDLTTITPTPTVEPTPTMSPQPRSLKAYQLNYGNTTAGLSLAKSEKVPGMVYWLYTPNGYTKDKKWPLVVYLYGPDYGRYLMDTTKKTSGLGGIIQGGRDYDALVLIPQEVWTRDKIHLRFVKEEMIPKIVEEYNIDTNKISLSGHSLAAGHALNMAEMYPGFFSAITPLSLCKTVDPKALLSSKIWIYHGNADTTCNQKPGNKMVKDITALGGFCKFTVIRAEHSNTDDKAIYNYNTVEWMIKQTLGEPVVE